MQTRRTFFRNSSLAAVTATLLPSVVLAETSGFARFSTYPGLKQFTKLINSSFRVQVGSALTQLRLIQATPSPAARAGSVTAGNERFSLKFQGDTATVLTQDTYVFEQAKLGRMDIFIVPLGGPKASLRLYEAHFDCPVSSESQARQHALAPRRQQTTQTP